MTRTPQTLSSLVFLLLLLLVSAAVANAQQPFGTDDADVTDRKAFHFQLSNQYDILQRSAYPALRQNTTVFELDYGLFTGLEIGVDGPLILISNSNTTVPKSVFGFGDLDLHAKYNFLREREGSSWPALSATVNVELPTGDVSKQLGSGVIDVFLNGIVQKSLGAKTMLRVNGGILFSGNTTTGEIGIKARGSVFVGGTSIVKQFSPKLDLGVELTGAASHSQLGGGQLQTQIGGNYRFKKNASFDFGLVAGKFAASPRFGVQLGISVDW